MSLCLSHSGSVKARVSLHPFSCVACLAIVLRGGADEPVLEEVLRSSDLWGAEEDTLG
jgi:hypothetical protein